MTVIQAKKERCSNNLRQAVRKTGGQAEVLSSRMLLFCLFGCDVMVTAHLDVISVACGENSPALVH